MADAVYMHFAVVTICLSVSRVVGPGGGSSPHCHDEFGLRGNIHESERHADATYGSREML